MRVAVVEARKYQCMEGYFFRVVYMGVSSIQTSFSLHAYMKAVLEVQVRYRRGWMVAWCEGCFVMLCVFHSCLYF